jgi:hypothetical protein
VVREGIRVDIAIHNKGKAKNAMRCPGDEARYSSLKFPDGKYLLTDSYCKHHAGKNVEVAPGESGRMIWGVFAPPDKKIRGGEKFKVDWYGMKTGPIMLRK